jgi:hypothetical protein
LYRATYWITAGLALALLLLDGAAGTVLTTTPDRGKVERDKNGTVRGGGVFVWLGGGYQGGK